MDGQLAHRLHDAADPFFTRRVHDADPAGAGALDRELGRQRDEIELIASENVPFDPEKPTVTSGIRLGTPAGTTRGFCDLEFEHIGDMITEVLDGLAATGPEANAPVEARVRAQAIALCRDFPIYPDL